MALNTRTNNPDQNMRNRTNQAINTNLASGPKRTNASMPMSGSNASMSDTDSENFHLTRNKTGVSLSGNTKSTASRMQNTQGATTSKRQRKD